MKVSSVVFSLALATVSVVRAEDVPVTLLEALARGDRANPELQAGVARSDAQAARAESVRRMRRPRIDFSAGWSRTDLPAAAFADRLDAGRLTMADLDVSALNAPGALSHLGSTLSLEMPIDVFGKVGGLSAALTAGADAASAGTREAAQEIRLRVTEAYREAEMAGRAVEVSARVRDTARAREAEIEARVETGRALKADLLRARARRREREADLAERRGQQRTALAGLDRLLGAPPGTSYVPNEEPPEVVPLDGDEALWVTRALRQRPALEMTRRKVAAAAAFVAHEKSGRLPDIGVVGRLQDDRIRADKGNASWAVGVGIRWTAFDPSRRKRESAAIAEQRAATFEEKAAADEVRLEVAVAYRRAVAARERHAAAIGGLEEGREAVRVVQERRKAGMATLTDELETEAAALGAALQEIGAAAGVAIADAALRRAAGEI